MELAPAKSTATGRLATKLSEFKAQLESLKSQDSAYKMTHKERFDEEKDKFKI